MYQHYLILGGAGLVGLQVCRRIAREMPARHIVVASLVEAESRAAVERLQREFGDRVSFIPAWGNLFVPSDLAHKSRGEILGDDSLRRRLLDTLYGDFDQAYEANHLVHLIQVHRPEVIVDCVNTATGLSYQDVFQGAAKVLDWMGPNGYDQRGTPDLEQFLLSQSVPQLIHHVRMLHRATTRYHTKVYVKIGTTGTGGMGLNIPYTHSEDKPSKVLLAKTEAGFGHTGLLFLLARTPDAPIVKEIKPAAMIGYRAVRRIVCSDKHGNRRLFEPVESTLGEQLALIDDQTAFIDRGQHIVSVVDTGENGVFTRGEFAAITALGQMEYVTPEEIAEKVVLEIRGANSGNDVISALDSSVLDPSYKAGLVRNAAMADLERAEHDATWPSVALGRLGPPELSKLLFEAQLLKEAFHTLEAALRVDGRKRTAEEVADAMQRQLALSPIRLQAPSIGIPVLYRDGKTLLRGPRVNVPEMVGHKHLVACKDAAQTDAWARKGWVDLRVGNAAVWLDRLQRMIDARIELRDEGSAGATIGSYLPVTFEIGEVVAWIFNNEIGGYRIK